ncbi:NRDE family protein [Puia sp. P3]|uniref:NRDE family protein n=1 Tax=Puia sp. P3 TaxID=3423952 RepID=UPI003D67B13B
MCTVTFVPSAEGFYLTSNRDERAGRGIAQPPKVYSDGPEGLIYPKDPDAGGSWIVMKESGSAAVLLNGAFLRHQRRSRYRISRGLVLLEIIRETDPLAHFRDMDLEDVEPFTLILLSDGTLRDCRWDGIRKYVLTPDPERPHIWSSVTLYDEAAAKERMQWFEEWCRGRKSPASADVIQFHRSAGKGDIRNDLVMNRDDRLFTVSVTSIVRANGDSRMVYNDLKSGIDAAVSFDNRSRGTNKESAWDRFCWFSKRFLTRLTHWEYWPAHVVYGPLYLYWLWLSIRARSLFFFSAANPGIEYAGFTHERKSSIYRQMPPDLFPRTWLCPLGTDWEALTKELDQRQLYFPLIAKPDIGERGRQVRLVRSASELRAYWLGSQVDFLVQEFVDLKMEAGIFYARIPGQDRGQITGIVGKQLLTVTGDGRSSIRILLRQNPRYHLHLRSLSARFGSYLDTVLPEGVRETLVPYGNHSRGAKFVDWSDKITEDLTRAIDTVCRQIPDFYFGRLDIKFSSWDDLLQGKNFSIIELNGAGSEPTHIYDPDHSLLFAWKEIIRHWRLLRRISLANSKNRNIPLMQLAEGLKMLRLHARHLQLIREL